MVIYGEYISWMSLETNFQNWGLHFVETISREKSNDGTDRPNDSHRGNQHFRSNL